MLGVLGARGELRLQPEHDALAVGVLGAHHRAGLDAVEHQVGLRVDQGLVDPVRHLLGTPQPVVIAGQENAGRPVGRGVEELVLLAPRDAAAVLGHPCVDELVAELLQRTGLLDACEPACPLQCERQPRHVVVVVVDPGPVVTQSM